MSGHSRPKIGYIVKMFPRLSETFIRNEILELERQGLDLHIFSLKRPTEAEAGLVVGSVRAQITYLPERVYREPLRALWGHLYVLFHFRRGYLRMFSHVLRKREADSLARNLRRFSKTCCLIREMKDLRHLHAHFANEPTRVACWARRICRSTYSVSTHAKDLFLEGRLGSPGLLSKLGQARFVITNSEYSRNDLAAAFKEGVPTRIVAIRNSIDLSSFPRRAEEPQRPLILSVGRLVEKKGFHHLIEACDGLKRSRVKFRCEIIGSGTLRESLEKMIEQRGLAHEVKLHGQMSQPQILQYMNQATVFALPCIVASNGDRDIMPNVLKEAMAVGVPVVTTRMDGIEELVTDGRSGILVPPSDSTSLAEAIVRLLQDADLRRRLADCARTVIEERFELRGNFSRLRDLLMEAVQEQDSVAEPVSQRENEPNARGVYHS